MKKKFPFIVILLLPFFLNAQELDLLSLVEEEKQKEYVTAGFKTNRVINLHSFENTSKGVLDFKINHRFGFLSSGINEFFGLDQSSVRLAFDYGLSDVWQIGIARSSSDKVIDAYSKYKFLRQSSGPGSFPFNASLVLGFGLKSNAFANEEYDYAFKHRLKYNAQLIIGRKFSKNFSLQIVPGYIHRNLVRSNLEKNDVWNLGFAFRQKLTKRIAINGEYIYVFPGQLAEELKNSISIGFDIETGGHVFQLHFTNSTLIHEAGFITETRGDILNGDIHFGFNVSRVFTIN